MDKKSLTNEVVTIRFSGDSGDGMQLTGNQFSENTAIFGNDLSTFPDFAIHNPFLLREIYINFSISFYF